MDVIDKWNLQVEPEENVHAEEKGPYILHSELEKAIKATRDKKTVREDNRSGDVLRILVTKMPRYYRR